MDEDEDLSLSCLSELEADDPDFPEPYGEDSEPLEPVIRTDDLILLQSSDGSTFPISRSLLAKHSSFFADLPSFLHSDNASTAVLPLPDVTSSGLKLLLDLLPRIPAGEKDKLYYAQWQRLYQHPVFGSMGWDDLPSIADAYAIAGTYDMDGFIMVFRSTSTDRTRPLFSWALTALMEPEWGYYPRMLDLEAMKTLRSPEVLPEGARELLGRCAAPALERYTSFRADWAGMTGRLKRELEVDLPVADGREGFTPRCGGMMGILGCPAREKWKLWGSMRRETAEKVYEMAINKDGDCPSYTSHLVVDGLVPCPTCAKRLNDTLRPALKTFWTESAVFTL